MPRRPRKPVKQSKSLKQAPQPKLHTRCAQPLTCRRFDALCIDVLRRKASPTKQRVNYHASRVLWQELVTTKKTQPSKKPLWKKVMDVFDQCHATAIGFHDLPFDVDTEKVWHLSASQSLRQPEQWEVRQIVRSFVKDGVRFFEVEWENTSELSAYVPSHLIREFEKTQRLKVKKAFIEAEAVDDSVDQE